MNTNTNISEDVYDLTLNQLGTVLYHIANNTRVSLDYTGKYKQDVMNRASSMLCAAVEVGPPEITEDEFIELLSDVMHDISADDTYKTIEDFIQGNAISNEDLEELCDAKVRQCVSDETMSCYCGLADQLKCEWSNDPWEEDNGLYRHYSQRV